jgi:DNA-binding XRE family transcriptional regulator
MAYKASITSNVLTWARESAKITEQSAAAKVSVSPNKLQAWESGKSLPTIKQAQTLAKAC